MTHKPPTILGLFVKALFPRFLFLTHGMLCIWLITKQTGDQDLWYLSFCLGFIVLEGVFNVLVRHGREFHWFCPSAFLYGAVLIVTMTILRERQVKCVQGNPADCKTVLKGDDGLTQVFNKWSYELRASIVEQTGMLVLIVGRWLLPQGSISREAFSQILLIYIGTAADIVEFSEIYGEKDIVKLNSDVLHGVMAVWALSVVQFSLTVALPEEGMRDEEEDEEEEEDEFQQISYFRSKMPNKVAPMSYMHYKSMLREGFANDASKTAKPIPTEAQLAFRDKYDTTSKTLDSLRLRAGSKLSTDGRNENPSESRTRKLTTTSITSQVNTAETRSRKYTTLSMTSQTQNAAPNSPALRVKLPQGDRTVSNIGSPMSVRNHRLAASPSSRRSKASASSPQSPKSSQSNESRKNKLSTDNSAPRKVSAWRRLVENTPLSRKRRKTRVRKDSIKASNSLGIGKKELHGCFRRYLDLIGIIIPVCMQDGPFFIVRFVLVAHYQVVTEMIILLIVKNALVIVVQVYRILILYCYEPITEPDIDDPSVRVRTAMSLNKKLSEQGVFRRQKTSLAVQAISRMQQQAQKKIDAGLQNGDLQKNETKDHVVLELKP